MPKQDSKPLTPEQRFKELETQLREAQEKAALFEAVLDVMRKDYGITVKKPSGRSSRRCCINPASAAVTLRATTGAMPLLTIRVPA